MLVPNMYLYLSTFESTCTLLTVQFDLNLTLACAVPASKKHVLRAHNQDHAFFVDLHANGNPLRVTHEHTVHEDASLHT